MGKINDDMYGSSPLRDGRIQTSDIGDKAVTSDKIADGAVTAEKLDSEIGTAFASSKLFIATATFEIGEGASIVGTLDKTYNEVFAAGEDGLIPVIRYINDDGDFEGTVFAYASEEDDVYMVTCSDSHVFYADDPDGEMTDVQPDDSDEEEIVGA